MSERLTRARAIAARLPKVAVTDKRRPGRADGVTFGRSKGGEAEFVPVSYAAQVFDAMSDASVIADLRARLELF